MPMRMHFFISLGVLRPERLTVHGESVTSVTSHEVKSHLRSEMAEALVPTE